MVIPAIRISPPGARAFSLVEMIAVIAILVTLMTAGIALMNGTGAQSRKTATDALIALIEQARTTAITSRSYVVLAIAEPGDVPANDRQCRLGLFKFASLPDPMPDPPALDKGVQMNRWQTLNTGVVLLPKQPTTADNQQIDLPNPLDQKEIKITYGAKNQSATVHAIVFNPRGGLQYPVGSTPLVVRIAEGGYRGPGNKAVANQPAGQSRPTENLLKIGRVTARPYRLD